jgi:hypothetical protein
MELIFQGSLVNRDVLFECYDEPKVIVVIAAHEMLRTVEGRCQKKQRHFLLFCFFFYKRKMLYYSLK